MLKWSPEAIVGVVALSLSTVGGLATTAVHWGATKSQIEHLEQGQTQMSQKLDAHQVELSMQSSHEATVEQKLDDMIDRLDRIEKEVNYGQRSAASHGH
jgi:hypothetical protein